jgi:hypothetical protein
MSGVGTDTGGSPVFGPRPSSGGGGGGAKYLATIYAAGLADNPTTDNLFGMASGNMRWWGDTGSALFPNAAFFESSSSPGDSRVPAWYTQRYYHTASGIGSVVSDGLAGYDPTWDGTFGSLNDLALVTQRVGFSKLATQSGFPGPSDYLEVGSEQFFNLAGLFRGADVWPIPGNNNPGARPSWQLRLYNNVDAASGLRAEIDGWGTYYGYPQPTANGITAVMDSYGEFTSVVPTAAGDGLGWFVRNGNTNPPRAIADAYMVTSSAAGQWGWEWWGYDGSNLSRLASMDWTNGIVFNTAVSFGGGGTTPVAYVTGTIDFTTTGFYAFNTPAVAGKKLVILTGRMVYLTRNATVTTGPSMSLAVNGSDIGVVTALPAASFNNLAAPGVINYLATTSPLVDTSAHPLQVNVTVGAVGTGLTSFTGYAVVTGIYV